MPAKLNGNSIEIQIPVLIEKGVELVVTEGDLVKKEDLLAKAGEAKLRTINAAQFLEVEGDIKKYVVRKEGDTLMPGDLLAVKKSMRGDKELVVKQAGTVVSIRENGEIDLKEIRTDVEVLAPVTGKVAEITDEEVSILIKATEFDLTEGLGDPRAGELLELATDRGIEMELDDITYVVQNKVVVLNRLTKAVWYKLLALGASGVVCGHIPSNFDSWWHGDVLAAIGVVGVEPDESLLGNWEKLDGHYCLVWPERKKIIVAS